MLVLLGVLCSILVHLPEEFFELLGAPLVQLSLADPLQALCFVVDFHEKVLDLKLQPERGLLIASERCCFL